MHISEYQFITEKFHGIIEDFQKENPQVNFEVIEDWEENPEYVDIQIIFDSEENDEVVGILISNLQEADLGMDFTRYSSKSQIYTASS